MHLEAARKGRWRSRMLVGFGSKAKPESYVREFASSTLCRHAEWRCCYSSFSFLQVCQ